MMTRFGGPGATMISVGSGDGQDDEALAYMTVFGYFLITCVQVLGIVLGEPINFQVINWGIIIQT